MELTREYVLSLFSYRDGNIFWKVSKGSRAQKDDLAGTIRKDGYRLVKIDGKNYLAHRLIFLYHRGYLPQFLDHIDGDPTNNNITNLREATRQENNWNMKKTMTKNGKPTSSEYKGVTWNKYHKKWRSRITIDDKENFLGYYDTETDAARAYNVAAIKYYGEFANLNTIPTPNPL